MIQSISINQKCNKYCALAFYGTPKQTKILDSRIKYLTQQLESKLKADEGVVCEVSDYKRFIPQFACSEQTIKTLEELFHASKFFSRISNNEKRFGKNFDFALKMNKLSKMTTKLIKNETDFESILKQLESNYINETDRYREKHYFYKTGYRGESVGTPPDTETITSCSRYTYGEDYFERFEEHRYLPYANFTLTEKEHYGLRVVLKHPSPKQVDKNMKIIADRYKIFQALVAMLKNTKELNAEQIKEVDNIISEIYYLMANTCPYFNGTNGMCDILMRSMYAAFGIDKPHIKQGISIDLEAFCMSLNYYKKIWNNFFESSP